jgi:hypothetical protein
MSVTSEEIKAIKTAVKYAVKQMGSAKLKTMSWFARNERNKLNKLEN